MSLSMNAIPAAFGLGLPTTGASGSGGITYGNYMANLTPQQIQADINNGTFESLPGAYSNAQLMANPNYTSQTAADYQGIVTADNIDFNGKPLSSYGLGPHDVGETILGSGYSNPGLTVDGKPISNGQAMAAYNQLADSQETSNGQVAKDVLGAAALVTASVFAPEIASSIGSALGGADGVTAAEALGDGVLTSGGAADGVTAAEALGDGVLSSGGVDGVTAADALGDGVLTNGGVNGVTAADALGDGVLTNGATSGLPSLSQVLSGASTVGKLLGSGVSSVGKLLGGGTNNNNTGNVNNSNNSSETGTGLTGLGTLAAAGGLAGLASTAKGIFSESPINNEGALNSATNLTNNSNSLMSQWNSYLYPQLQQQLSTTGADANAFTDQMNKVSSQMGQLATNEANNQTNIFDPNLKTMADQVAAYNTAGNQEQQAELALGDVNTAYDNQMRAQNQQMAAAGIDPNSGRYTAANQALGVQQAGAAAAAANQARQAAIALGWQKENTLQGYEGQNTSNLATDSGLSTNAAAAGLNAQNTQLANIGNVANTGSAVTGAANSGYSSAGNIQSNIAGDQQKATTADQQGIGTLLGTGLSSLNSSNGGVIANGLSSLGKGIGSLFSGSSTPSTGSGLNTSSIPSIGNNSTGSSSTTQNSNDLNSPAIGDGSSPPIDNQVTTPSNLDSWGNGSGSTGWGDTGTNYSYT